LIQASSAHAGHLIEHKWIALSTYAILFLATPHQGAEIVKSALQLLKLASLYNKTNNMLLKHLTSDSELLQQQLSDYNAISSKFQMKFFYENLPTILPGGISSIVSDNLFLVFNLMPFYQDCSSLLSCGSWYSQCGDYRLE
jgi:hypothetical protein